MTEFFGATEAFENIFGKSIFLCMENLEQFLVTSWDAIGCLLLLQAPGPPLTPAPTLAPPPPPRTEPFPKRPPAPPPSPPPLPPSPHPRPPARPPVSAAGLRSTRRSAA